MTVSSIFIGLVRNSLRERMQKHRCSLDEACSHLQETYGRAAEAEQLLAALNAARQELAEMFSRRQVMRPAMVGTRNHTEWYTGPDENSIHWPAYRDYLISKGWQENIDSLDDASTRILSRLACPATTGPDYRLQGLVLGYVQSGKTASMTATMAKAADAGYRVFVVLAGMTDSLRLQTQRRIEADLTSHYRSHWEWRTGSGEDGDFVGGSQQFRAPEDGNLILVIKKNAAILRRLLNTIRGTADTILGNQPVLIIDDECDQASVNSARSDNDVTVINGLIRRILDRLPRCCYLGYTATPFANLLINPAQAADGSSDLYPRDFIISLPRPSAYFGAERLFGEDPESAEEDGAAGQAMIRHIPDEEAALLRPPSRAARESFDPDIPPSLEEALLHFLMATAARHAREQTNQHSSMLIHTSIYRAQHFQMRRRVDAWLGKLTDRITRNEPELHTYLEELWRSEAAQVPSEGFGLAPVPFPQVMHHLPDVIRRVETAVENSDAEDHERLDFETPGRHYIVVGGNVLARGLTIEGLSVSYFLRSSTQYDTLMQMGRWFGYRRGYEDLPRIWMTRDMAIAFRDLATVEAAIRADIDEMWHQDLTPQDFAVRIPKIPKMQVTARTRMRFAEECDISYRGEHLQTFRFDLDRARLQAHWQAASDLINQAQTQCSSRDDHHSHRIFREVPNRLILEFLSRYRFHPKHRDLQAVPDFIRAELAAGQEDMRLWNLVVVGSSGNARRSHEPLGSLGPVPTNIRSQLKTDMDFADIKALMSKDEVTLDLGDASNNFKGWLKQRGEENCWASRKRFREEQLHTRQGHSCPLLLIYPIEAESQPQKRNSLGRVPLNAPTDVIGLGIIFPGSPLSQPKKYVRVRLPDDLEQPNEELDEELPEAQS